MLPCSSGFVSRANQLTVITSLVTGKIEDLASLVTSIIMFYVGFDVLRDTLQKIFSNETVSIDPLGAGVGVVSALVMLGVYFYNLRLAKRAKSKALKQPQKTIFQTRHISWNVDRDRCQCF